MRVKKDIFFFIMLFLAFLHAVLRSSPESSFSVYRMLLPFSLLLISLKNYKQTTYYYVLFVFLIFYNLILTYVYCNQYTHFVVMVLHYFSLFNIFLIVKYLYGKYGFEQLYKFFRAFFFLSIGVAILEYVTELRLPNTAIYEDGSVSAFAWNQNELGTALFSFFVLYLIYEKNNFIKIATICVYFFLNFVNDAKVVLIASVLAIFLYLHQVWFSKKVKYVLNFTGIFLIFVLFMLPYDEIYVSFRDYEISLEVLLVNPIEHIVTLTPFPDLGISIETRANAVIYAIQEFIDSNFMGIGMGNTLVMLEKPEYSMEAAKSIHNFPVQVLVENGFLILMFYIAVLVKFIKVMWKNTSKKDILAYVAIPSFFLGSMGSSVGIFSNYFYMSCLFFIILILMKKESIINEDNKLKSEIK